MWKDNIPVNHRLRSKRITIPSSYPHPRRGRLVGKYFRGTPFFSSIDEVYFPTYGALDPRSYYYPTLNIKREYCTVMNEDKIMIARRNYQVCFMYGTQQDMDDFSTNGVRNLRKFMSLSENPVHPLPSVEEVASELTSNTKNENPVLGTCLGFFKASNDPFLSYYVEEISNK